MTREKVKVILARPLKVKIEVDIDPPGDFKTEAKVLLQPIPLSINTFQQPDLFSGKIHALLCRQWDTRVKGRDWFDKGGHFSDCTRG